MHEGKMASQETDNKTLYKNMKRKLKTLLFENECFQEELRKAQKALLKVERDKSFLLDRILQYQPGPESSSDSEQTDESDNESYNKDSRRKKPLTEQSSSYSLNAQGTSKSSSAKKKRTTHSVLGSGVVLSKNINSSRHGSKQASSVGSSSQIGFSKGSSSHSKLKSSLQASLASSVE